MNNIQDFIKKEDGTVVNINNNDHRRARNRNYIKRKQTEVLGSIDKKGKIDFLEERINSLESKLDQIITLLKG